MPSYSAERANARREEILNACEKLYSEKSFKEITLKDVSGEITCGRSSIYNYFSTKEEIFLALLKREYDLLGDRFLENNEKYANLTTEKTAAIIAETLAARPLLLKILSMNCYDLEENTSFEQLVDFKKSYVRRVTLLKNFLTKFKPNFTPREIDDCLYSLLPLIFGVYPYSATTEKKKKAVARAGGTHREITAYEIIYNRAVRILKD